MLIILFFFRSDRIGRSKTSSVLRAQRYYKIRDEARELKISVAEMKKIVEEREKRKLEEEEALRIELRIRDERRLEEKRKRQEEERVVYYELDENGRPVGALRIRREFVTEPQPQSQPQLQLQQLEPSEPESNLISYASNGRSSIRIVRSKKQEESIQVTNDNSANNQPKRSRILGVSEDGVEIIDGRASPNTRYVLMEIDGVPKRIIKSGDGLRTKSSRWNVSKKNPHENKRPI